MTKYPSPSDIEEMKARGYDRSTIDQAVELSKRWHEAASIRSAIESAFSGVRLGNGVGLTEAQGLDDYADEATRAAYRAADEKEDWRRISADQLNKCNSSLSFFDDEGMRFHLPAYLVADLDGDYKFGLAYALTQTPILSEQFRLLSKEQRAAVRRYLEVHLARARL